MIEEHKNVEHAEHKHIEHTEEHEKKSKISLTRFGKNGRDILENISSITIILSGVLIFIGILAGSFIQGTISFAVFGSFFIMVGIIIYIASQFIEVK